MCYGSYRYAEKEAETDKVEKESKQAGTKKEQIITSNTQYIIEKYDQDSEELVKEERTIPPEYIGLSRNQMENLLIQEMAIMSKEEEERGLYSMTLQMFSPEKIVIRKVYSETREEGFLLKILDGEVAIYSQDGYELYEKTGITEDNLTQEDKKALEKGYCVKNEKELYSILENFSS